MPVSSPEKARTEALRVISLISDWPVVSLGHWPTPIEEVRHRKFRELLVKRDDLAGFGRCGTSGVKARKLEGFLGFVSRSHYEEVMILLANMTNLGHDIVPALVKLQVRSRLLIVNDPVLAPAERELLFRDLGARVEFLGPSQLGGTIRLRAAALQAKRAGIRAIAVLPSPAHPTAVIGAARGLLEAVQQLNLSKRPIPSLLFIAAAAGTTVTGFVLASSLLRAAGLANIRVVAIPVVPYRLEYWMPFLLFSARRVLGMRVRLPPGDFQTFRLPRNLTYGRFDDYLEDVCRRVRQEFGFVVDPIYGAKSWSAMEEYVDCSGISGKESAMFWHCGYSPDWESFRNR